ncbi:lysophospholipid acyltransferase family protein [Zoogloea sp.]|uniref:lysophospholipid acyltransferase family protein n=1 Tax=Zoogloea sp. TaxID=49181 RepID=UPI00321F7461
MLVDRLLASALCGFARALTGVRALWLGSAPDAGPRVYFANHRSHGDFVLIWASLPPPLRRSTRPVAGADYWLTTPFRSFLINRVFRGVCIDRRPGRSGPNPVDQMGEALAAGESLILFPEGTRNMGDELLPFKSGLHHLAKAHPEAELIPVWIENLGRVMPKGSLIPVPLLCTLSFGPPLPRVDGESRDAFLARARAALLDLAPPAD